MKDMLNVIESNILLIHHWDTDGLCSAALLLEYFNRDDITTWTPPLGTFYLQPEHIQQAQGYDHVIVCDMALPESNVTEIAEKTKVTVIDHHHQTPIQGINHINPVAHGGKGDQYPSNTWVIKEALGLKNQLKIILGIIGDREHKIKDNPPFWEMIQKYTAEEGTDLDKLLELVYLIDSSYKVGDRESVMKTPHLLRGYQSINDIQSNNQWRENLKKLDEKMEKVLSEPPLDVDSVQVKRLDTPYAIISQVTRRLAWGTGKDTIVLNTGFFSDQDQLYARSNIVDMHRLIEKAKRRGYNAGGKKDVIGAILPKTETESFLTETIEYIKENR